VSKQRRIVLAIGEPYGTIALDTRRSPACTEHSFMPVSSAISRRFGCITTGVPTATASQTPLYRSAALAGSISGCIFTPRLALSRRMADRGGTSILSRIKPQARMW
jgi:hypothetical protein